MQFHRDNRSLNLYASVLSYNPSGFYKWAMCMQPRTSESLCCHKAKTTGSFSIIHIQNDKHMLPFSFAFLLLWLRVSLTPYLGIVHILPQGTCSLYSGCGKKVFALYSCDISSGLNLTSHSRNNWYFTWVAVHSFIICLCCYVACLTKDVFIKCKSLVANRLWWWQRKLFLTDGEFNEFN